ncbi:MAG: substrate-binding domain-containing protein, partial [Propionibacteriaceae bacterium]|nr:substrate-binding domain-containing protein [Propionibacteriaceae bacterium]
LANRPYPDAIFAMHDLGALGALSVLRESGLATPDDVAVVGYYDTPLAAAEGLSSVGTELRYMGRRSLELLLDRLAGQETESETVPVKLIIRQSSGGPRPTG